LLTPLKCDRDEIRHTQALAYILGGNRELFKKDALISVITKIKEVCPRGTQEFKTASETLNMTKTATEIKVTAECKNDIGRCDIWIEVHRHTTHRLIIIENKIGAPRCAPINLRDISRLRVNGANDITRHPHCLYYLHLRGRTKKRK